MSNVRLEKVENNFAFFEVGYEPAEVERAFKDVFRFYSNKLSIPGFRRGKVPAKVIETRVGSGQVAEMVHEDLKEGAVKLAFAESGLRPRRGDIRWTTEPPIAKGEPVAFTFEAPVLPVVKLPPFEGAELVYTPTVVDDEMRARLQLQLRHRNANHVEIGPEECLEAGQSVTITLSSSFADTGEPSPFENDKVVYEVGLPDNLPGFDEHLYGMKSGEGREFAYRMPDDFVDERVAGKDLSVKVHLAKAEKKVLPELNMDFIKEKFNLDSMEAFSEALEVLLYREVEEENAARKQELALEQILSGAEVLVTDDMVSPQVDAMVADQEGMLRRNGIALDDFLSKQGRTIKELRADYEPRAYQMIKRDLVIAALADANDIDVQDREILKEAARIAQRYQMKRNQAQELLRNREFVIRTHSRLIEDKVLAFLVEKVKFVVSGAEPEDGADQAESDGLFDAANDAQPHMQDEGGESGQEPLFE